MVFDLLFKTLLAPLFGKLADKIGAKKVISVGFACLGVSFLLNAFMTGANAVVMRILVAVFASFGGVMTCAPVFSFLIESTPEKNRSSVIACMSSMFFLEGYLASLLATWFISVASGFVLNIFGFEFSEMSLVFLAGSVFIFMASLSLVSKQKEKSN